MTLQEMLKEEREEGHKEGLKEGLKKGDKKGRLEERKAMIPEILAEKNISIESIEKKLDEINDIDLLKSLTIAAVSAKNAEDFLTSLEAIQE